MLLKSAFSLLVIAVSVVASPGVARVDCAPGSEICASSTSTARRSLPVERAECEPGSELCGASSTPERRDFPSVEPPAKRMTNAERLARGLPLNKPQARATRTSRSTPSDLPPVQYSGIIEVHNANNGNLIGYIAKNLVNGGAQFGYDPAITNALVVSFELPAGATSGSPQISSAANSNPSWPLLGLLQGRDDTDSNVKSGSYQYLYIGGVANPGTQPGDRPTNIDNSYFIGSPRTAETYVWTFDTTTSSLTLSWVNQDGTLPSLQTWTQSTGLYAGGDQAAFVSRYPAPATAVTYKFVSQ